MFLIWNVVEKDAYVLDEGIYEPQLLFNDNAQAKKLKNHPAVLWKLKNLREHKGSSKE